MEEIVVYPGKDLEAMSFAVNYHRWLLEEFTPYIGKNIVEVGAGTGSFSNLLLETGPEDIALVEPSEMFDELERNIPVDHTSTKVRLFRSLFVSAIQEITKESAPDTIIYVNVLEHIEDDVRELELINETLAPNGHALIFVPALRSLFSPFDRDLGHFRRYGKAEIEKKVSNAGFKIVKTRYFDFTGVLPWFLKYQVLRSRSLGAGAVSMYDNLVVPILKRTETLIGPPIGKNVLLVAQKR